MRTHATTRRLLGALAVLATLTLTATACGSDDSGAGDGSGAPKDVQAALDKGGKVTVWAWEPTLKKVAEDFE
ncbi:sugar ABC transporter substrate-binding protein, partial [Streptomyces sp. NPDC006482]